jgi:hypothetical protein
MSEPDRVDAVRLPPVTQLGMVSLALIVAAGIYLSAHIPEQVSGLVHVSGFASHSVSLAPAIVLLGASALMLAVNLLALARVDGFAWARFFEIARWALLAYAIIAGMIEYVFLRNHTSGGPLVVLSFALVLFAVHVPVLIGFTVARYQES